MQPILIMHNMIKKIKPGPAKGTSYKEAKRSFEFGQRLYEIRNRKGLTQQELATKMGTSKRIISYLERQAKNPTVEMIRKISDALEVPQRVFFDDKTINSIEETPPVIKSLKMELPKLSKLPRKEQESLTLIIKSFLAKQKVG